MYPNCKTCGKPIVHLSGLNIRTKAPLNHYDEDGILVKEESYSPYDGIGGECNACLSKRQGED